MGFDIIQMVANQEKPMDWPMANSEALIDGLDLLRLYRWQDLQDYRCHFMILFAWHQVFLEKDLI